MATNKTFSGTVGLNTQAFAKFAKALRTTQPVIAKELKVNLRAAGEIVAADARQRSSFSSRIPGSVKVRVSAGSVIIAAGGKAAPDAEPYENDGKEGTFRHPLYGNRAYWYSQKAHPFLLPALNANAPAAIQAAVDALETAVEAVKALSEI